MIQPLFRRGRITSDENKSVSDENVKKKQKKRKQMFGEMRDEKKLRICVNLNPFDIDKEISMRSHFARECGAIAEEDKASSTLFRTLNSKPVYTENNIDYGDYRMLTVKDT